MEARTPELEGFELLDPMRRGATGQLFRAKDRRSGEALVIKVVDPALVDGRYSTILTAEAPGAVAFRHGSAVRTMFAGRVGNDTVIATELAVGRTLEEVMGRSASRPMPWEAVCWIALQLAETLRSAHATPWAEGESKGMFHCAVSPHVIFIAPSGDVKLLGVGLGRSRLCLPPSRERLPYRAPELFERQKPDELTDIYSLGATIYDAISGTRMFARESVAEIKDAILSDTPPSLRTIRPEVDPAIDDLILSMLSKFPRSRPRFDVVEHTLRALSKQAAFSRSAVAGFVSDLFGDGDVRPDPPAEQPSLRSPSVPPPNDTSPQPTGFYPGYSIDDLIERLILSKKSEPKVAPLELDEPAPPPPPEILSDDALLPEVRKVEPSDENERPSLSGIDDNKDFDVDALVNAIVTGSAKPSPRPSTPTPRTAAPRGSTPTPPAQPAPRPQTPPPRAQTPTPRASTKPSVPDMSKALDTFDSEGAFDVDAIVNAIVSTAPKTRDLSRGAPDDRTEPEQRGIAVSKKKTPRQLPLVHGGEREVTPPEIKSTADVLHMGDAALEPGSIIGDRYRVIEQLGEGGMSVVYKVEHTLLLKHMALKLLRPELSSLPSVVERFQQEARSVCQLDDPNIVRVTDFGRQLDGSLFLVMDFLEGESLANRLRRDGKIPAQESVDIAVQILAGLAHAHLHGVVHRDLKPENIMLVPRFDRIQVKILDFGIAKLAHRDTVESAKPLTQAGTVFGTPRYMSPEQASAERVDLRADLYAVGVILYECLSGQPPFDGPSAVKILSKVLTEPPPPLKLGLPTPKEGRVLEAIIMKALEKEKEDRYPSAFVFRDALSSALDTT